MFTFYAILVCLLAFGLIKSLEMWLGNSNESLYDDIAEGNLGSRI